MKRLLNIMLVIALIIPMTFFTVNAGEEGNTPEEDKSQFVLANGLDLTKRVTPFGNPQDRTYQVDLTVDGEIETVMHDADVFIIIDLTSHTVANPVMLSYYLRSVWNMCYTIVTGEQNTEAERKINFRLLVTSNEEKPIVEEKVYGFKKDYSALGDPNLLYFYNGEAIDDRTVLTQVNFYQTYDTGIQDGNTLLGYLLRLSINSLPNRVDEYKNSMAFNEAKLVNTVTQGHKGEVGHYILDNKNKPNVNIAAAIKRMNEIIDEEHLGKSQAVMLVDELPSNDPDVKIDLENGIKNNVSENVDEGEILSPILQQTYKRYQESKEKGVLFHTFGIEWFESQNVSIKPMWQEFITNIGNNKIRDNPNEDEYGVWDNTNKIYKENVWKAYDSTQITDFSINFEWDHSIAQTSIPLNIRTEMNTQLLTVAEHVGQGLEIITDFANIVFVQDEIPDAFHVLNTEEFKPTVSTKKDEQTDWFLASNNLVERTDIYPANDMGMLNVPDAEDRWETSGIRWKMNHLTTEDGTYKFTFYIKANEDYFGGEYIDANKDAGVYYMDYSQYQLHGNKDPSEWKNEYFTKEDFVYKIEDTRSDTSVGEPTYDYVYLDEDKQQKQKNPSFAEAQTGEDKCDINVYVPWYHETLNGEATIFYGDNITISSADLNDSSNGLYNWGKSNERNANVEYYIPYYASIHEQDGGICETESYASWKDKNGSPLKFDYSWKVYSNVDKSVPTLITKIDSGEQKQLNEIMLSFIGEPDADVIYELSYKLSKDKETSNFINDINLEAGSWPRSDSDSKYEFDKFIGGETKVTVNVEYGSLKLSKELISTAISEDELSQIDFKTGFPVEVKTDNGFVSVPTIRQTPDGSVVLNGLKRGEYSLKEIVPQKFQFVEFIDLYRNVNSWKNSNYTIEIGFDEKNEETNCYQSLQKNEIKIVNDFYLNKWNSSIQEIDNLFITDDFMNSNSPSEVSNE